MNFKNAIIIINILLFIFSVFILLFQIVGQNQFNLSYGDDFFVAGLILLNTLMIAFLKKEWKIASSLLIFFNLLAIVFAIFLLVGWTFFTAFDDSDKVLYTEILTFLLIIPSSFLSSSYFLTSFSKKENTQKAFSIKDLLKNIVKISKLIIGLIVVYILLVIIFDNLL